MGKVRGRITVGWFLAGTLAGIPRKWRRTHSKIKSHSALGQAERQFIYRKKLAVNILRRKNITLKMLNSIMLGGFVVVKR